MEMSDDGIDSSITMDTNSPTTATIDALDTLGVSSIEHPYIFNLNGCVFYISIEEYKDLRRFVLSRDMKAQVEETSGKRVHYSDKCPKAFAKLLKVMREGRDGIPNNDKERRRLRTEAADFRMYDVMNTINKVISEREIIHKTYEHYQSIVFHVGVTNIEVFSVSKAKILKSNSLLKDYLDMKEPPRDTTGQLCIRRPTTYAKYVFDHFDKNVQVLPSSEEVLHGILTESIAYKMPNLTRLVKRKFITLDKMKRQEAERHSDGGHESNAHSSEELPIAPNDLEIREKENSSNQTMDDPTNVDEMDGYETQEDPIIENSDHSIPIDKNTQAEGSIVMEKPAGTNKIQRRQIDFDEDEDVWSDASDDISPAFTAQNSQTTKKRRGRGGKPTRFRPTLLSIVEEADNGSPNASPKTTLACSPVSARLDHSGGGIPHFSKTNPVTQPVDMNEIKKGTIRLLLSDGSTMEFSHNEFEKEPEVLKQLLQLPPSTVYQLECTERVAKQLFHYVTTKNFDFEGFNSLELSTLKDVAKKMKLQELVDICVSKIEDIESAQSKKVPKRRSSLSTGDEEDKADSPSPAKIARV